MRFNAIKVMMGLLVVAMFGLAGCSGGSSGGDTSNSSNSNAATKTLSSIEVKTSNPSIAVGASTQFQAIGMYSDKSTQDITTSAAWNSSDKSVAAVGDDANSKGKATAVAPGTATITAASGNISSQAVVLSVSGPYTIRGIQLDSGGTPVVGATVSMVVNSITYTTQTDGNGEYTLTIAANDAVNLPDSFSYSISKSGYVPVTYTRTKSNTNYQASIAMIIIPPSPDNSYVVLETPPLTHHLGDGKFDPATQPVNSQFQYRTPEGITYSKSFSLTNQVAQFTSATITFVHKGIQASEGFNDVLIINSNTYNLPSSDPNGNYTQFSLTLNSNIFIANQNNTLTIQSGTTNPGNDYDDFEFQNIVIHFSN